MNAGCMLCHTILYVCMHVCMCIGSSIGRDVSRQATGLLIGDTQAGLCNYMRLF